MEAVINCCIHLRLLQIVIQENNTVQYEPSAMKSGFQNGKFAHILYRIVLACPLTPVHNRRYASDPQQGPFSESNEFETNKVLRDDTPISLTIALPTTAKFHG